MTATFTWIATIDGTDVADLVVDSASVNYGRASLTFGASQPCSCNHLW